MSVIQTTTHPFKYYLMELIEDIVPEEVFREAYEKEHKLPADANLFIQFELVDETPQRMRQRPSFQRQVAQALSEAYDEKTTHYRDRERRSLYNKGYYNVAGWQVEANFIENRPGCSVTTNRFPLYDLPQILMGLDALDAYGFRPDGEINIHITSCSNAQPLDLRQVMNLHVMMEARKALLEQALNVSEEIRIIVNIDTLALSIPLGAFDLRKIEAATCLLHQMAIQAGQTGKVRMKPAETSNPRYQMRTWLLRLGFIGEQFARPRQTLLTNLEGSSAFANG